MINPRQRFLVDSPPKKIWMGDVTATQHYYLTHHARAVIVTAATSLYRILSSLHSVRLIIDEGSQIKEYTTVAVISKHFRKIPQSHYHR